MWLPNIFRRNKAQPTKLFIDQEQVAFCNDLREEFENNKGSTFDKLTRHLYSSENAPALRNTFKELALRWHEDDPEAAKAAVEKAKQYAGWDRTSLTLRATEKHGFVPSSGRFPDSVLDEITRETFLYKVAQETLNLMVPSRNTTQPQSNSSLEKKGFGT